MAGTGGYRELKVWHRSVDVAVRCYAVARAMPDYERFALADQLRRSAVSIASNIAEGHQLHSKKSYVHHLRISRGSLAEVETQIAIATKVGYVTESAVEPLLEELDEIGRMIAGLIRGVNKVDD